MPTRAVQPMAPPHTKKHAHQYVLRSSNGAMALRRAVLFVDRDPMRAFGRGLRGWSLGLWFFWVLGQGGGGGGGGAVIDGAHAPNQPPPTVCSTRFARANIDA